MRIDEQELQTNKISWLSFKQLETYFSNPDSRIENLYDTSIEQFTKDLDTIIEFSTKKLGLYNKIGEFSVVIDSNPIRMEKAGKLESHVQKGEMLISRLNKILNRFFKHKNRPTVSPNKIRIKSWKFSNFHCTQKFQVRNLYSIKPVSVTYNSTQQDYKYDKQIISKFCIEELNGNIKKLLIIDSIKNGKIKREKYIDDKKINRQHYNSEIRNHRLNRCLMKTFLFYQINKHKTSRKLQNCIQEYDKTESSFVIAKPISDRICSNREFEISTPIHSEKFQTEYIKNSVFNGPIQKHKNEVVYNNNDLQSKDKAPSENHNNTHEILGMDIGPIYTADDYYDLKPGNHYN